VLCQNTTPAGQERIKYSIRPCKLPYGNSRDINFVTGEKRRWQCFQGNNHNRFTSRPCSLTRCPKAANRAFDVGACFRPKGMGQDGLDGMKNGGSTEYVGVAKTRLSSILVNSRELSHWAVHLLSAVHWLNGVKEHAFLHSGQGAIAGD
jgi:hypothetical protein